MQSGRYQGERVNKRTGYGVCPRCHKPINYRVTKGGKKYTAESGLVMPHKCSHFAAHQSTLY